MNNMISNVAEPFIPPRVDAAPQKSNSAPDRQRKDYSPGENRRTERPERSTEIPPKADSEGQVTSGGKEDKQDFNEVLAKKMSKKENRPIKKERKPQKSEPRNSEPIPPGILIAETKIPEKILNKEISPLINITRAKQRVQAKTEKPGIIDAVVKKPITKKLAEVTPVKEVVTPVDKITVSDKGTKTATNGIPIKTLVGEPKPNKPVINLSKPTEKVQIKAGKSKAAQPQTVKPEIVKPEIVKPEIVKPETVKPEIVKPEIVKPEIVKPEIVKPEIVKPETVQPEAVQPVSKTPQNNKNQLLTDKNLNLTQADHNKINTQAPKLDQKPVIVQSEDIPQADSQNKFDKSITKAKSDIASKASMTSNPESNTVTDKNTVLTPSGTANKDLHKTLAKDSGSETNSDNITNISADSDSKAVTGSTSRLDFKPQPANNIVNQVTEQIRSSMTRGREQISIALDPPELGKIVIKFQQSNGEIVGIIEADKARTHREIAIEMPVIIKSLNDSGILVKRIEVVLTEQNTQDALSDNSASQNNNTGRQRFDGSSDNQQNEGAGTGSRNFSKQYNPANNADNYANTVSDDAINMYA